MPSASILPLEIEEKILDHLAEDNDSHSALKVCALVCQAFLHKCRKHIFGSIVLSDHWAVSRPATHAFESLLRGRPEIVNCIRNLDYTIRAADLTSPTLQESLKRISRLEILTVRWSDSNWAEFDWSNNPIHPALLHLLHLPTLTHFMVTRINNFVLSDLVPCINLKYLNIGLYTTGAAETSFPAALPEHSIRLNEFVVAVGTADAIMKLCTARRPDGQPLIDFRSLSRITVVLQSPDEGAASQELFRRCQNLTDVYVSFWEPRHVRPSLADMLRPSMHTLKHIVVDIEVDNVDVDPLFGIPSELEDMRTKNIIESVTIGIMVQMDEDCRQGDDWGRLDEVLTTPGWFALKRVSLAIEISSYGRSDDRLEMALRKLPETQFPRLSTSNSVSFNFEVILVWV